ncbi:unnamed protein product [Caenorhabditis auriculariae]|uniref:CID domain-containing protein n=1 Tax=Caenorhabditis auriculariae TaxID=2777116 RepID=A0A8S1H3N1_9PELO|nr:unnamed protein product [Caenorhabditis auriculariae]
MGGMDNELVKKFNAELSSIYESKPPLSKTKIQDITKAALKAKALYKHVVFSVEKFLAKCKAEYKIPVLYIIDSIIRGSKHQLKEKDVYAARFLKNFSKTLSDLLACSPPEQMRVVRTLNLWTANGVYKPEEMEVFRNQCKSEGIEIDYEAVEKAVKGKKADMRIYGGVYIKKDKLPQSTAPASLPAPGSDGLLGAAPPQISGFDFHTPQKVVPAPLKEQPSDEIPPGGISERELLSLITQSGIDPSGIYSKDMNLLKKAHAAVVQSLNHHMSERAAQAAQARAMRPADIKNVLTSQFGDYSDDENEEEQQKAAEKKEEEDKPPTHEEIYEYASHLVQFPDVANALQVILHERITELSKIASEHRAAMMSTASPMPPPSMATLPPPTHNQLLQGGQINAAALAQNALLANLPMNLNLAQLAANLQGINPGAQTQLLGQLNLGALLPGNNLPQGFPLPTTAGNNPANAAFEQFAKQQEIFKQITAGQLPPMTSAPPPNIQALQNLHQQHSQPPPPHHLIPQHPPPLPIQPQSRQAFEDEMAAAAQKQMRMIESEMEASHSNRIHEDDRGRRDRKRSRSRDRNDRDRGRNRDSRESKSDRERRKMGLPTLVPGKTFIASRTLWFGRLPSNCSESDIRSAVEPAGDPAQIRMISTKACAYVTMETRRAAYDVVNKLSRDLQVQRKRVKISWAMGPGTKEEYAEWWDEEKGVTSIPWDKFPAEMEKVFFAQTGGVAPTAPPLPQTSDSADTNSSSLSTSAAKLPPGLPPGYNFAGVAGLPPMLPSGFPIGIPPPKAGQMVMPPNLPPGFQVPPHMLRGMPPGLPPPGAPPGVPPPPGINGLAALRPPGPPPPLGAPPSNFPRPPGPPGVPPPAPDQFGRPPRGPPGTEGSLFPPGVPPPPHSFGRPPRGFSDQNSPNFHNRGGFGGGPSFRGRGDFHGGRGGSDRKSFDRDRSEGRFGGGDAGRARPFWDKDNEAPRFDEGPRRRFPNRWEEGGEERRGDRPDRHSDRDRRDDNNYDRERGRREDRSRNEDRRDFGRRSNFEERKSSRDFNITRRSPPGPESEELAPPGVDNFVPPKYLSVDEQMVSSTTADNDNGVSNGQNEVVPANPTVASTSAPSPPHPPPQTEAPDLTNKPVGEMQYLEVPMDVE